MAEPTHHRLPPAPNLAQLRHDRLLTAHASWSPVMTRQQARHAVRSLRCNTIQHADMNR